MGEVFNSFNNGKAGKKVLLDAEAFISLYQRLGKNMLSFLGNGNYMVPYSVISELENQRAVKRAENGKILVPWDMMGQIYDAVSMKRLEVLNIPFSEKDMERVKSYLMNGSGDKKNSRLGKGDLALILAAENLGEDVVILSRDSDIGAIVSGGAYQNIEAMPVEQYLAPA